MTADATLARELAALQDELSAPRRERPSPAPEPEPKPEPPAAEPPAAEPKPQPSAEGGEDRRTAEQLGDFIDTLKEFIEEAEHNVSEHPAASVIGALLVGILIGRLLGRR